MKNDIYFEGVSFGELDIKLVDFYIREPTDKEDFSLPLPLELNFSWAQNDGNDHLSRLKLDLKILGPNNSKKDPLVAMRAVFISKVGLLKNGLPTKSFISFDMPKALKVKLLDVSLSTVRGILIARTAGFTIGSTHLPILNTEKLIEEAEVVYNEQS
ncbi:MAG: hypothetical protein AB8F78_20030 [Saprospiraceae bacterium]